VFGVALAVRGALKATPEVKHALAKFAQCGVPHVVLARPLKSGAFGKLLDRLGMPAQCIWYVTDASTKNVQAALSSGLNVIWVGGSARLSMNGGLHIVTSVSEALDVLSEPYTRSVLALRYLLTLPDDE
jgi:hypothetical protein